MNFETGLKRSVAVCAVLVAGAIGTGAFAADAVVPSAFPGAVRLLLPPRLYAVPGVEMNVYFDNICLAVNPLNDAFDVDCAKGQQQAERWTFVPTEQDVGRYPFAVEVRDETNGLVARAESVLEVVSGKAGAGQPVSVLTIGDSLTHAAV